MSIAVTGSLAGSAWMEAFGQPAPAGFNPEKVSRSAEEGIVTAGVNYAGLDEESSLARIGLDSAVVRTRHLGEPSNTKKVEVIHPRGGNAQRVPAYSLAGTESYLTFVRNRPKNNKRHSAMERRSLWFAPES